MATLVGTGQITIIDNNDIIISASQPSSPILNQLWLNTSITPPVLMMWNGAIWINASANLSDISAVNNGNRRVRYIRDWTNGSDIGTSNHWIEIKAMAGDVNRAAGVIPTLHNGTTDASMSWSATAPASRVTDGILTGTGAYGTTNTGLQYLKIDLGAIYEDINYLHVWHYYADSRKCNNSKTEISVDGLNWLALHDSDITGTYTEPVTGDGKVILVNAGSSIQYASEAVHRWLKPGTTVIDGGQIATDSITVDKLNVGNRGLQFSGFEISCNSPVANRVYWTAGSVIWINDSNTLITSPVGAADALWTTGRLYVYWAKGSPLSFQTTTVAATAYSADNVIVAIYNGGTDLVVNYGRTIIDGSDIVTGTITSDSIKTGTLSTDKLEIGIVSIVNETWNGAAPLNRWTAVSGAGALSIVQEGDGLIGSNYLKVSNNVSWLVGDTNIPFDPDRLYRIRAKARKNSGGTGTFYIGWVGYAADGETYVNVSGADLSASQHYHGCAGVNLGTAWEDIEGYTKGHADIGSNGTTIKGTLQNPGKMHPNVRFIRPLILANYQGTGITDVDSFIVEWMPVSLSPEWFIDGTFSKTLTVGDSKVKIDGALKKITINDGQRDRVTLGNLGSSYGLDIVNNTGGSIFTASGDINGLRVQGLTVNGQSTLNGVVTIGGANITYTGGQTLQSLMPAESGATNTTNTNQLTDGALLGSSLNYTENSTTYIGRPIGGSYSGGATVTGAIKITLPQSWTATMLQFSVDVFNYTTGTSFTVLIGGYTYSGTPTWINTTASIVGQSSSNHTIRFGHDGAKCCVWIGEETTVWKYCKVVVKNLVAGHSVYAISDWKDDWAVTIAPTIDPAQVKVTDTDNLVHASDVNMVAGTLAGDLVSLATTANLDSQNALGKLDDLASDSKITVSEKPALFLEWKKLYDEKADIVAKATTLGIAAELTAYATTKWTALQTYLNAAPISMENPPTTGAAWIADSTTIDLADPALFRTRFIDVYSTRQTLLNKMAEVASTTADWANVADRPEDSYLLNNLVTSTEWTVGEVPSTWIPYNGNTYNQMISGITGPKGISETLWHCLSDGVTAFASGFGAVGSDINIDKTKVYRFVVPIKHVNASPTGKFHFGITTGGSNVCTLNTSTLNTNPYFLSSINRSSLENGKWYLMVGYIFPAGTTNATTAGAGLYDTTTGQLVIAGNSFNWSSTATTVNLRSFMYLPTSTADVQYYGHPLVHQINGTEPSLRDYFASSTVLNSELSTTHIMDATGWTTLPTSGADRTTTVIDGGLVTTGRLEVGTATLGSCNAGINGAVTGTPTTDIRFWAGGNFAAATGGTAPFRVTNAGALTATNATLTGSITATSGYIGTAGNGWVIGDGKIYKGRTGLTTGAAGVYIGTDGIALGTNVASPQFKVTAAGVLTCTGANIRGTLNADDIITGTITVPSTKSPYTSDESSLRMARGTFRTQNTSTPVITSGAGFTITRLGVGYYEIVYTNPFTVMPTIVISLGNYGVTPELQVSASPITVTTFSIGLTNGSVAVDRPNAEINFIIIGS